MNQPMDPASPGYGFVADVAALKLYGSEMQHDGEDAMECLNSLIERARAILKEDDEL